MKLKIGDFGIFKKFRKFRSRTLDVISEKAKNAPLGETFSDLSWPQRKRHKASELS